jgi:hypothetical protein
MKLVALLEKCLVVTTAALMVMRRAQVWLLFARVVAAPVEGD